MGEQVAAGSKRGNDVCESRLQSPSRTDRLNIEVRNVYQPITERNETVKINAGFTSGQRVQKVLSFLMTDKTVNMYLENFIQISD